MEQALLLTKSIEIPSLPMHIQNSLEGVPMTGLLERNIKEAIIASHLLCADQEKLHRKRKHLRPAYNLPREYGSFNERRTSILINKLLSECEKYAGRFINSQRRLIDNANFKVNVSKNDDILQFGIKAQKIITSSRPVETIKRKYDSELPDIHPVKYTISIPKQHTYSLETIYPFGDNSIGFHPHTIFVHFDKQKVKNIFDVEVNTSQFQSRNMLTAFTVAAARAKQLYGDSALDSISKPIAVQSIQTDGNTFHFGVFQLNTLRFDKIEGPKNYWFHNRNQDLFQLCGNASGMPVLEGFNKDVFRYIYAFYSNS